MYRRAPILVAVAALAAIILAGQAAAGDSSKGRKVTVAHGTFAHRSWSLAVKGRHHRICYYLSLRGRITAKGGAVCMFNRHRPPEWSRLVGSSDLNDSATVELNVTQKRVRSMRLRIGHPHTDRPSEWIRVRNHRITRHQAHKAGVRRNFRFAVLHSRGTLCVKEFVLFNRDGDRIDKQRVPCEF